MPRCACNLLRCNMRRCSVYPGMMHTVTGYDAHCNLLQCTLSPATMQHATMLFITHLLDRRRWWRHDDRIVIPDLRLLADEKHKALLQEPAHCITTGTWQTRNTRHYYRRLADEKHRALLQTSGRRETQGITTDAWQTRNTGHYSRRLRGGNLKRVRVKT